jgi:hypothetical protein
MKKILKSFVSAHDAVNWLTKNRVEGASIETTSTLKSVGYGRIPSGNYHVIALKSDKPPSEDFFTPYDASTDAFEGARAKIDTSMKKRPTLLRQMGPLASKVSEIRADAAAAEGYDEHPAEVAAEDAVDDLIHDTASWFNITDPEKIERLFRLIDEDEEGRFIRRMRRKSIVKNIVDKVLKSMGY